MTVFPQGGLSVRILARAGLVLLLMGASPAWSGSPGKSGLFKQKEALVERFLSRSDTSQRVGDKPEAKAMMDRARRELARARELKAGGGGAEALKALDGALKLAVQASRHSASPESRAWFHKARYEDHLQGVGTFRSAYLLHLKRLREGGASVSGGVDLDEVDGLTGEARRRAAKGDHLGANKLLTRARERLTDGIRTLLNNTTQVYELKFDTPADEYEYEKRRGESLESLVRLVLSGKEVGAGAKRMIQGYVSESAKLRQVGAGQAAKGAHETAIKTMEQSNALLGRALRAAGIMVPL